MRKRNTLLTGDNMKSSFLKTKHYAKLQARAKRILDRELSKPSDKWDEALISECEETMLYCAEMQKSLAGEKNEATRTTHSPRAKRAIIIALAVLTVLLVSSAVAQAAGFRIWSAIVHWDPDYLRVNYGGHQYDDPPIGAASSEHNTPVEGETVTEEFDSIEKLREAANVGIVLPGSEYDPYFKSAKLSRTVDVESIVMEYFVSGKQVVYNVLYFEHEIGDDNYAWSSWQNGENDSVIEKDINGTKCIFAHSDVSSMCTFEHAGGLYNLSGGADDMALIEEMVTGMLEGS